MLCIDDNILLDWLKYEIWGGGQIVLLLIDGHNVRDCSRPF